MANDLEIKPPGANIPRSTGILWGPAKCGKTTLLATLPGRKVLVNIDPDGHEATGWRDDISLLDLSIYEPDEIVRMGRDKVPSLLKQTEDLKEGDSVIVDSLSSYGWAALLTAIKEKVGESRTFKPSIEAPGLSAYGARTNYIVDMVRKILKVTGQRGVHCWFTAHMDTPTTNDQGAFLYQTMTLSDNGINQTSLSISEVWFMDRNDKKQTIAIQPVRGRKPMGSRMFSMDGAPEFTLEYAINKPDLQQPHSIAMFWKLYLANGRKKLPIPGTVEYMKLYKEYA